jgi:hypothetical protein
VIEDAMVAATRTVVSSLAMHEISRIAVFKP